MISQKESSINNKTVGRDEYDPQIYAKIQEIQRQYRAASVADISYRSSMNELVSHVRYLESEVRYLKSVINTNSLLFDASIDEIYGDKI